MPIAAEAGFAGVVRRDANRPGIAGSRCWSGAGLVGVELVCVNPMLVHRGREEEDFTRDRSDFKDSTIIASRVADLRCYVPYVLEGHWCRLRHLGARRDDQLVVAGSARQRLRDLLECAWPAVLAAAADPLDAITWRAALAVSADPARSSPWASTPSPRRCARSCPAGAAQRRNLRILRAIFAAAQTPGRCRHANGAAACERAAYARR